jgi:hypothetical protein
MGGCAVRRLPGSDLPAHAHRIPMNCQNQIQIPTEEVEQAEFVQYLRLKGLKFTAIPNSTYTTSFKQKIKNKRQGLNPGLPDLVICLPDKLLFIEMKRVKNGTVSNYQKEWIEELNKIPNVEAVVCRGCGEAIDTVEANLKKTNDNPHYQGKDKEQPACF